MGMKLHIGCGSQIKPGYINIDEFNKDADVMMRVQDLNYPDNSVERIEGYMILEHLSPTEALDFLKNSYRMLEEGGKLILEVPDLEKMSRLTLVFKDDPEYLDKGAFGLRGFFAEPTHHMTVGDYHKWGYTPASLTHLAKKGGFSKCLITDGISHYYPLRDMRLEATK